MKTTGQAVFFITHSVEGACYLATSIIVVSPRPGRVLAAIRAPFSARGSDGDSRAVKSSPEFVALRERVLKSGRWSPEDRSENHLCVRHAAPPDHGRLSRPERHGEVSSTGRRCRREEARPCC